MQHTVGIKKENLAKAAHILSGFLTDEFLLYLKTRNGHWNIEGSDFHTRKNGLDA
jgi:starvation-inducible DNA-binding protein